MFFNILFFLMCLLSTQHIIPLPEIILQSIEVQPTFWQRTRQVIQNCMSFSTDESYKIQTNPYDQFIQICKNWNTNEFTNFFNYHLHNQHINEQHILTAYELYRYIPFQNYIGTLTGFAEHIEQLHKHIDHGKKCKHKVKYIAGLDHKQFKQIIKKLHQELQNKRSIQQQQQELQLKKQRLSIQKNQRTVMTQQRDTLAILSRVWQSESEEYDGAVAARYHARSKAAERILCSNNNWYEQSYTVNTPARQALAHRSISADKFGTLYGNALQQTLHKEFVTVVNSTALNNNTYQHNSVITNLSNTVFEFADIGREYTAQGAVVQASEIADFCWAALDCIQAIGEGFCDGIKNTVNMIAHPVDTVTNIAKGIGILAYHIGHVIHEVVDFTELLITDYHAAEKKWDDMCYHFDQVIQAMQAKQQELKLRDYCKGAATFATECLLQARLIRGISSLCQSAQKQIPKLVSQFGEYIPDKKVLLSTAEGIEFEIAREAQNILQRSVSVGVPLSESAGHCLTNFLFSVEKEIVHLRTLFDCTRKGFAEFSNKFIKINYQHIFGIELKITKGNVKLGGFHHDFMGAIEKGNVFNFTNVLKGKSEFYSTDVIINGRSTYKTFFPQAWSREKVISKIYEAFDDFISSGATAKLVKGDKYLINGIIKEGVEIEMYITKSGEIVTAYPKL